MVKKVKIEDGIQSSVVRWVKDNHSQVRIFSIRNETNRFRVEECDVGHPDLQLERTDIDNIERIMKLELKRKKGKKDKQDKLLDSQKKWNASFDATYRKNCHRYVAYGYDEAISLIKAWLSFS